MLLWLYDEICSLNHLLDEDQGKVALLSHASGENLKNKFNSFLPLCQCQGYSTIDYKLILKTNTEHNEMEN